MFSKLLLLALQYAIIQSEAIPGYEDYNYPVNNIPSPEDYPHLYSKVVSKPVPYRVGPPLQVYRYPQHYLSEEDYATPKLEPVQQVRRPIRPKKRPKPIQRQPIQVQPRVVTNEDYGYAVHRQDLPEEEYPSPRLEEVQQVARPIRPHQIPQPKEPITEQPKVAAHYDYGYSVSDPHTGDSKTQYETRRGDVVKGSYSVVDADGTKRTVDYTADAKHGFNAVVRSEKPEITQATEEVKEVREPSDDLERQETIYQKPPPYKRTRPYLVSHGHPILREELADEAAQQEAVYQKPAVPKKTRPYITPSGRAYIRDEQLEQAHQQNIYQKPVYTKKPRVYIDHTGHVVSRSDQLGELDQQEIIYQKPVSPKKTRPYAPPQHDIAQEEHEEYPPQQEVIYEKPVKKNRQRIASPRQTIIRNEYVSIPGNPPRASHAPVLLQPSAPNLDVQHFSRPNYNVRQQGPPVRVAPTEEDSEHYDVSQAQVQYLGERRSRPDNVELQKVRTNPKKVPVAYEDVPNHRFVPLPPSRFRMPTLVAVDPNVQQNHGPPQAPYYVITRFVNVPHARQGA